MSNVTISIEDDVLVKVRRLAVEQRTTLTAMVRQILQQLAMREETRIEEVISLLRESFDHSELSVGARTWTREDLHAR